MVNSVNAFAKRSLAHRAKVFKEARAATGKGIMFKGVPLEELDPTRDELLALLSDVFQRLDHEQKAHECTLDFLKGAR